MDNQWLRLVDIHRVCGSSAECQRNVVRGPSIDGYHPLFGRGGGGGKFLDHPKTRPAIHLSRFVSKNLVGGFGKSGRAWAAITQRSPLVRFLVAGWLGANVRSTESLAGLTGAER
jgi:hypothetical protein